MDFDIQAIGGGILGFALILIAIIIVISLLAYLYMWYKNYKKFSYVTIIFAKDGFGQIIFKKDLAGVYVDTKTQAKRFFLKKHNSSLPADNIPYITNEKNQKIVFIRQIGLKNFQYIYNFQNLFSDNPTFTVGEEDVNWALNQFDRSKKIFGETMFTKLLPYLGLILMGVFILGMVAVILQKIPSVITEMQQLAQVLKEIAIAQSGTTVIN